jgi:hypothetical protein
LVGESEKEDDKFFFHAVFGSTSMGLAYIVSQGNITATIVWFAITTGVTAGLSYYREKE